MGINGQDIISCKGGVGLHVTRGERRIQEMESHLKCLRKKLCMLESMLPGSVTNTENHEDEPETDGQEGKCEDSCSNLYEKKEDGGQMCVLKSLAIKEKKLRGEIFNMECKENKYINALSKIKVNQSDNEEIKKSEDDLSDLTRADNSSPRSQKRESGVKEKISQLEEYSKKLCQCLKSIQNNRMEWSQEAEYLSKELNGFEGNQGLRNFLEFCKPGRNEDEGDDCPCGEPAKCNSCTICTCSEWEEDLKISLQEKLKEDKEPTIINEKPVKKKRNCRCFQSSSDSETSKSLEINDIYNCSILKMQSDISIATTSIPSTVEDFIIGDEEDKEKFCCFCNPEDECQNCCKICFYDYESCDFCDICKQERFRGGMDLGIFSEELSNKSCRESLSSVMNKFTPEPEKKIKEKSQDEYKEVPSSAEASQIPRNFQIEELKLNLELLRARNNALKKLIQDRSNQIKFDPSKDKIIAALLEEIKTSTPNHPKIWNHPKEKKINKQMPKKDLTIGLFVLFVTFSSHLLGSNGISSLSLLFRFLFEIIAFPYWATSQIYRYLLMLYDSLKEFILDNSKILPDIVQNQKLTQSDKFDILSIFELISIFLIIGTLTKFLFSAKNLTHKKFSKNPLRIIIRSSVKKKVMFFLRPIIFVQIRIKFVLHFIFLIFSDLIEFFLPKIFRNFSHRLTNSFIDTFRILFKRKSSLAFSNFVFLIVGFLINKMWNLNGVKIDLEFLRWFYNHYIFYETLKLESKSNFVDESTSGKFYKSPNFFSFLNVSLQNIFKYGR